MGTSLDKLDGARFGAVSRIEGDAGPALEVDEDRKEP